MIQTIQLTPGVVLRHYPDKRFKTAVLSLQFQRPLCREEAALNALLSSVLLRGTEKNPDMRSITARLDSLYGANISPLMRRIGDRQTIGLFLSCLEDRFALPGDCVLEPSLELLREILLEPKLVDGIFDPEFVESEKKNLIADIESELNDKRSYAAVQMLRSMCAGDSFALSLRGEKADVEAITGDAHQAFLNAIEAYAFNTLCCPAADATTVQLYSVYTERLRDELGAKFQLVAWEPKADYEGVIGVWNKSTHATIADVDAHAIVYWMTGAQAGVAVNASLTNFKYDGELIIDTKYTQVELEAAIKAGKCMFHNVNGVTRVLEDINTLLTLSDTKGEVFQSNQTMRVCDQIANDVAVLFNTRYVGTVPNDAPGRAHLWNNIVKLIQELEKIRAVQEFDPDIVTCAQGDSKKAVLCNISGLNIVNAMAQLYMSVIIQ